MHALTCDRRLRKHIQQCLESFQHRTMPQSRKRPAAVAVTIVDEADAANLDGLESAEGPPDQAALILTRRSAALSHHAGQWALPGGRMEAGEGPEDTALRELEEEVGLCLGKEDIMGRLDDFSTRSGFVIKPVVIWAGRGMRLTPNPAEVASIHRIPVAEFLRKDAPIVEESSESKNPVLMMPVGRGWIAAPSPSRARRSASPGAAVR